jgi:hypothetical protein
MGRWNFENAEYNTNIVGDEHSLAKIAKLAFEKGIDPSGMSYKELEDTVYGPEEEVVVVVEETFVVTEAHRLLSLILGTDTAKSATEAEAVDLLHTAIKSGISLVAENEIVEFLLGLEEEPEPVLVVCEHAPELPENVAAEVDENYINETVWVVSHATSEPTITERVATIAAEVKAAAKAAKKVNIFSALYKDSSGRYHAPKGQSFYLVHQIDGLVQNFRTLKAISAYIQGGWKITLQRIEA